MADTIFDDYRKRLCSCLNNFDCTPVFQLAEDIKLLWKEERQMFLCGNGGSAANAIHISNDFLYPIARANGKGIKVNVLSANQAVMTCLGNDVGYENIFSHQLETLGRQGDILIALSGSGNSPNILKVIEAAKKMRIKSYAFLGFNGGKCLGLVDVPIHFAVNDMQISEDLQLIVGHMLMQWLCKAPLGGRND